MSDEERRTLRRRLWQYWALNSLLLIVLLHVLAVAGLPVLGDIALAAYMVSGVAFVIAERRSRTRRE